MIDFWVKVKSLVYKKRLYSTGFRVVEKRKVLGFTVLKQIVTEGQIERIYMKSMHVTKKYSAEGMYKDIVHNHFDVVDLASNPEEKPLVSVIVPNYNHAPFLRQRLESIYNQSYTNIEVILLDDASTDDSIEILKEYANKYADKTRLIINKENSGKVFIQWNKGLSMARGTYIWIAESDDYCDLNFLEELVKGLSHQSVMISFARSIFMREGKNVGSQEKYLKDLTLSWLEPFIMTAHNLVSEAFAIKNVIPNVSGAIFRNIGVIPEEVTTVWKNMSLCGDWLFYLWLIRGGSISYTPRVTNYYRIHTESTSLKIQRTLDYYKETFQISCWVARWYDVNLSAFEIVKRNLRQHYKALHHVEDTEPIEQIYDIEQIKQQKKLRQPNIVICGAALTQGGGEIFPIYLANAMRQLGITVTFIDFRSVSCDKKIRKKLDATIPLIELSSIIYLADILDCLGAEIIHTHEGNVDRAVGHVIGNKQGHCKHVITLHGMYEAIKKEDLNNILRKVLNSCSAFVYIADKNLIPLQEHLSQLHMYKIDNGLPLLPITPHRREDLGIEPNAFCITLASRAIYEKGWKEAIKAVKIAHTSLERPIHLILLGDGECYNELEKDKDLPPYIHLLGRKGDVRSYFAMSDIGLLPSYFKGESFPLVLIESLMSGTPVIASDIGEIRNILTNEAGEMAGIVFSLNDGKVPVELLAQHIQELASNEALYQKLKANIPSIVQKFDIYNTARQYLKVYEEALHSK